MCLLDLLKKEKILVKNLIFQMEKVKIEGLSDYSKLKIEMEIDKIKGELAETKSEIAKYIQERRHYDKK